MDKLSKGIMDKVYNLLEAYPNVAVVSVYFDTENNYTTVNMRYMIREDHLQRAEMKFDAHS